MLRLTIFGFISLFLIGCSTETTITETDIDPKPFNVYLDMSEDDVRTLYSDCQFISESPKYGLYGGGEEGFDVMRNDTVLFHIWEHWEKNEIGGFILLDPKQSFENAYVGMRLSDLLKIYPKAHSSINLITSKEDIHIPQKNCWFTLDSSEDDYAADYKWNKGELEFVKYIDMSKKVESIFVKAST
jgi:hypothetical protein